MGNKGEKFFVIEENGLSKIYYTGAGMGEKEELTICVVERMEISLKLI